MRLIKTLWDQSQALKIEQWLKSQNIQFELQPHPHHQPKGWRLWILDEDQVELAKKWLTDIEQGAFDLDAAITNLAENIPLQLEPTRETNVCKPAPAYFTLALAFSLGLVHFIIYYLAPASGALLSKFYIDAPLASTKAWQGLYPCFVEFIQNGSWPTSSWSLFLYHFRQGDWWRLCSPSFIHANWIHLTFNMMWLQTLSPQIELRIGRLKLCFFILLTAAVTNLCQYVMTGYHFLGFSGVITAFIGLYFTKSRLYPWESYQIPSGMFGFIGFYLIFTLSLQILSFILDITGAASFEPGVANTSHISGLLVGWLLGRTSWMSADLLSTHINSKSVK